MVSVEALDEWLISSSSSSSLWASYELFVSKVDAPEGYEIASRLLYIGSLDDLKDKVVRLALLVLAIESSFSTLRTCAT